MNRRDVSEVKKLYKSDKATIGTVAGCYCNAAGIKGTFNKSFLNLKEDEVHKYLEIFKKGLSGTLDKNIYSIPFSEDGSNDSMKSLLDKVLASRLKNDELLNTLYEQMLERYTITEEKIILVLYNVYDVMTKAADGNKLDESEEVYEYIHVFICPVKLEKPGLYWNNSDLVHKDLRWCIDAPEASFLYPSFEDRSSDKSRTTIYVRKPASLKLVEDMLQTETSKSSDEQTNDFIEALTNSLEHSTDKVKVVKAIQKQVVDILESSDSGELDKNRVSDILQKSGLSQKELNDFDDIYSAEVTSVVNLMDSKKIEIKSPDIVVKVKKEVSHAIETSNVNGKKCLIIDLGAVSDVEVNGVNL